MEARRFSRVPLNSMALLESERDACQGALVNLSRAGAQLSSAYPIHPHDYVSLNLSLPLQTPSLEIELAAVRWVQGRTFGVEFLQITQSEERRLQDFLDTHPARKPSS